MDLSGFSSFGEHVELSANTIISVLLLLLIVFDLRRLQLGISYVRLGLTVVSLFVPAQLHSVVVLLVLGCGSTNLESTLSVYVRYLGRSIGPKIVAPATWVVGLLAAVLFVTLRVLPTTLMRLLPIFNLVWLVALILLLEPSLVAERFLTLTDLQTVVVETILAGGQLILFCCLIDLLCLSLCRPKEDED